MGDSPVREIYSADRRRRVLIVRRSNGFFGYEEEYFSDEPMEQCWCAISQVPYAICESEDAALAEARGRVKWLVEASQ